jgi:3-keto-disaccharide hydrolase/VCBS repeat protein
MKNRLQVRFSLVVVCSFCLSIVAQDFTPDWTFADSSLSEFEQKGAARWKSQNGEIIAESTDSAGGWLILKRPLQDQQVALSVKIQEGAAAGVLLRTEMTEKGVSGVYIPLSNNESGVYQLQLGASGEELSRAPLPPSRRPMIRSSAMAEHWGEEPVPGFSNLPDPPKATSASPAPSQDNSQRNDRQVALLPSQWNTLQVILDADIVTVSLNGRRGGPTAITFDRMMGFGPIALHASGKGEVRFKDLAIKDLNHKFEPKEVVSENFRMQRLSDFYFGWCATVADFNRDGVKDVAAGPFYYLGPDYTERREFTAARTYNPSAQFAQSMVNFAHDFTSDGWPDMLVVDQRPIWLYVNPKGEPRRWDRFKVIANQSTETTLLKDIDGDGNPEVLFGGDGVIAYAKPGDAGPTASWEIHAVSEKGRVNPHGLGVGDINGDGRTDILNSTGWWEQPAKPHSEQPWPFHAASFGRGGAEMGVYDVNGDGLNDVVTALSAHGWGLAWFEQKRRQGGGPEFVEHRIMGDFSTPNAGDVTFSEPHAANFADIDGDGILDFIVGKRHFSHLDSYLDPDPHGAAVLYWYRTVRDRNAPGGARFVPELIHNRSGVGSHFQTIDINDDGFLDIVTSTNRGTFIFWGRGRQTRRGN